MKNNM